MHATLVLLHDSMCCLHASLVLNLAMHTSILTLHDGLSAATMCAQAQRDFFGSHTYERIDKPGWFHTVWDPRNSADSITTSSYNN